MKARRRVTGTQVGLALVVVVVVARAIQQHPREFAVGGSLGLIGAAVAVTLWSTWRRAQGRALATLERGISATDDMTGTEFEHYVARLMRAAGMTGVKVSGGAGDMGADVIGRTRDGRRIVVQCKRYKTNVGSPHIQRFAGTVFSVHRADVAMVVTTTGFTTQARDFARMAGITLVDRATLSRWIRTRTSPVDTSQARR